MHARPAGKLVLLEAVDQLQWWFQGCCQVRYRDQMDLQTSKCVTVKTAENATCIEGQNPESSGPNLKLWLKNAHAAQRWLGVRTCNVACGIPAI